MTKILILAYVLLTIPGVVACGASGEPEPPAPETDTHGIPIIRVEGRYATSLTSDAETLVAAMGSYFVGQVVEEGTTQRHLTAGAEGDRKIPISTFHVRVERSRGSAAEGSLIDVEQFGGVTTGAAGPMRILLENDTPMAIGNRYLFIAKEERPGVYGASAFARFPLHGDLVAAPPGWETTGVSGELTGMTLDEAFARLGEE
ncbi:MAG TPA: hypothetical protein VMR52_04445 [Dehalococcoidia bacterium]|nr:hypothetical protein [Dehalococcoidia bacterium]